MASNNERTLNTIHGPSIAAELRKSHPGRSDQYILDLLNEKVGPKASARAAANSKARANEIADIVKRHTSIATIGETSPKPISLNAQLEAGRAASAAKKQAQILYNQKQASKPGFFHPGVAGGRRTKRKTHRKHKRTHKRRRSNK